MPHNRIDYLLFFDLAIPTPRRKPVSIARVMRTICDTLTFQKKSRKIMTCVFWMRIIKHRTAKTQIMTVLGFIPTPPPSARFAPACRIYLYQQLAEKATKFALTRHVLRSVRQGEHRGITQHEGTKAKSLLDELIYRYLCLFSSHHSSQYPLGFPNAETPVIFPNAESI